MSANLQRHLKRHGHIHPADAHPALAAVTVDLHHSILPPGKGAENHAKTTVIDAADARTHHVAGIQNGLEPRLDFMRQGGPALSGYTHKARRHSDTRQGLCKRLGIAGDDHNIPTPQWQHPKRPAPFLLDESLTSWHEGLQNQAFRDQAN